MPTLYCLAKPRLVALLAEGVDRNPFGLSGAALFFVALLAEGVDRNYQ